jgi:hypothetical protein
MYDHNGKQSVMDADEARQYIEHLESALHAAREERDMLKATIATPEIYAGIISEVVEKDFAALLKSEREARELAEVERFNAGINKAAEICQLWVDSPCCCLGNGPCDHIRTAGGIQARLLKESRPVPKEPAAVEEIGK